MEQVVGHGGLSLSGQFGDSLQENYTLNRLDTLHYTSELNRKQNKQCFKDAFYRLAKIIFRIVLKHFAKKYVLEKLF